MTTNPLLETEDLPLFDAIRPEHVGPAVNTLLAAAEAALTRATGPDVPVNYDAMSAVLDVATERLTRAWAAVGHMHAVVNTPALRAAYTDNLPKVVDFHTRLGADAGLFAKYRALAASPDAAHWSAARRRALDIALRDFRLSGAELQGADRQRYAELQDRLAELGQRFSEHVLDATDAFSYLATEAEIQGLPADVVNAARQSAEAAGQTGYRLTLQAPCYVPVMQYARDRALRERMYRAYVTRASEFGPAELNNTDLIRETLSLRTEEARLLGYPDAAHQSLVSKMASNPAEVLQFLVNLAHRARPGALRDLDQLRNFARTELALTDLQAWDISFASQALKESHYAFSEQAVREYFTAPKVMDGLFRIVETLFGVRIKADVAPVWHPSVQFFRIEAHAPEAADTAPRLLGQFYLDLYARPGKRAGAWMDDARDRWRRPEGRLQTPVAHLVCNFAPPSMRDGVERPALLSHDDVVTLFHEFGHGLHLMLTRVEELGVSGISGVEWDAVELPSQFMENFAWEWDVVKHLTAHVDTGAPLPRELFDRMHAAKNFQSGLDTLRQVEFALVNMRLHCDPDAATRVAEVVASVRAEVAVLTPPAFNRGINTFSHIFAGGYAAGYYSYKWAEVLSADVWGAFEDAAAQTGQVLDADTGRRLREQIFETGGSRPAIDNFTAFRGRAPTIDALLHQQGLA